MTPMMTLCTHLLIKCDALNRNVEALLWFSTLMPHLREVVRGGVWHLLLKGPMPHVLTICTVHILLSHGAEVEGGGYVHDIT